MPDINPNHLLLVVTGAHLRAEAADRPVAYSLQQEINGWLGLNVAQNDRWLMPLVCSDVWYLNNEHLHTRPTVSVGGPGVNALSAYLHPRLPSALQVDDQLVVQLDVEMIDLRVNIWGMDYAHTANAVNLFTSKYLDAYMRAAITQIEPNE
ncbi:MAG: hypothetical protein ACYTGQ_13945 [Planctomycetota bacterium]|jgi:hypothetical protein